MITNNLSALPPGAAEQIFRLFDQGTDNLPLCRSNVAALAEFDLNSEKLPTLEALKNLIKEKLPLLPCLRHFLIKEEDGFAWAPFSANLDKMITEKTIGPQALHAEIVSILGSKLPEDAPWRLVFLSGYNADKFALVWCVRHEVIDGGSRAHIFEILFGGEGQKPFIRPDQEKISAIPSELLQVTESPETAGLFWKDIPFTTEREIIALQMPAVLLQSIGKKFGISGNDLYLTAMGRALWQWRRQVCPSLPPEAELALSVPINLRPQGDYHAGNRFYTSRLKLPEHFSPRNVAEQTNLFRNKDIREGLAALYRENPSIAAAKCPSAEYFSAGISSFRITKTLKWDKYPLSRTAQIFNTPAKTMPVFSAFSSYEPKAEKPDETVSTLFFSLDSGIEGLTDLPALWKENVLTLAHEAGIDLTPFGEDPIQPFC